MENEIQCASLSLLRGMNFNHYIDVTYVPWGYKNGNLIEYNENIEGEPKRPWTRMLQGAFDF